MGVHLTFDIQELFGDSRFSSINVMEVKGWVNIEIKRKVRGIEQWKQNTI